MAEPGYWSMSDAEAKNLRDYLTKGGFLILDDFRQQEWGNFELMMSQALPDGRWVDLDVKSPIFHSFFEIDVARHRPAGVRRGGRPMFRGWYQDNDPTKRLLVVAAYNTDMSEFWEWSNTGYAPIDDEQRSLQDRHQSLHVRHHALGIASGSDRHRGALWKQASQKKSSGWNRRRTSRWPTR